MDLAFVFLYYSSVLVIADDNSVNSSSFTTTTTTTTPLVMITEGARTFTIVQLCIGGPIILFIQIQIYRMSGIQSDHGLTKPQIMVYKAYLDDFKHKKSALTNLK